MPCQNVRRGDILKVAPGPGFDAGRIQKSKRNRWHLRVDEALIDFDITPSNDVDERRYMNCRHLLTENVTVRHDEHARHPSAAKHHMLARRGGIAILGNIPGLE